jgi:hypothetical protein
MNGEQKDCFQAVAPDLQAAQQQIRRLSEALDAAHSRLRVVEAGKQTLRDHSVQNLQSAGRIAAMQESLATAARVHDAEKRLCLDLRAQLAALESAVAARDGLIESLLRPRSWRFTAPIRHVKRFLFRTTARE